jgi:diguanylate cyclase (GGDEF)-like protein
LSNVDPSSRRGASLEEAPGWRQPGLGGRSRSLPVRPAGKAPHELRELEGYMFLAALLVVTILCLTLAENVVSSAYFTAMRAVLTFAVFIVCATAIARLRSARKSFVRTGAPSARDGITGLPDEQYFWTRLREEHARTRQYADPFSVAVLDVNSLSSVSRAYGEIAADALLEHVARIIDAAKRGSDVAVRLTDDEFALLLLDCDKEGASTFATRLQQYLNGQPVNLAFDGRTLNVPIAISIGIASVTNREMSSEEIVARARHNLAIAKEDHDTRRERWAI